MLRHRLFALLPAVLLIACNDATTATSPKATAPALPPVAPAILSYTGVIETSGADLIPLYIRVEGGSRIALAGAETVRLANVVGAEVTLRGTMDAADALIVESFRVVSVAGLEAADGVLVKTADGYALRLLLDGSMLTLIDLPDELKAHVGERVWVAGPTDAAPVLYGVIGGTT